MSYTPGPWVAQGHKVYGPIHPESKHPNGRVFVATVAQGTLRADSLLYGGEDRFGFDSEADVRLITAAPKLLEALEIAKGIIDNYIDKPVIAGYSQIKDAIEKARGEE